MIVYSNDFSSDPFWTTDQPQNFYWDALGGYFLARTINGVPNETPNRYAFEEINLDVTETFSISYDYLILDAEGYGISHFGLFDESLQVSGSDIFSLNAGHGNFNGGSLQAYDINILTTAGTNEGQGGVTANSEGGEIGVWYSVSLEYDASLSTLSFSLYDRASGDLILDLTRTLSGTFDEEMILLGISHDPIGSSSVYSEDPTHFQLTAFDNIVVEGQPSAPVSSSLVFFDDFERPDSDMAGNGWIEVRETQPGDTAFGSSTLSIVGGHLAFTYDAEGNLPLPSDLLQPYMTHDLPTDLGETGFEIQFTFTPGDDERVSHFVGVADTSSGQFLAEVIGPTFYIPGSGFGIELYRSDGTTSNSGFTLYRFNEDYNFEFDNFLSQEVIVAARNTSFQFEQEDQIDVSFQVTTEGAWTVNISNGTITDTFAGATNALTETFDQVVMSSIYAGLYGIDGSIFYDANQTEIVKFDDLAVYALGEAEPPEPEVVPFDFNVFTAMQLATAAYAPIEDQPQAPDTGDRLMETSVYLSLFGGSTTLRAVEGFENSEGVSITDSRGFYINQNAAALVAHTEDALVISFRGTNDNDGNPETIIDAFLQSGLLQGILKAGGPAGKALGANIAFGKAINAIIPDDEVQSPDVEDWFDLESHWLLFNELWESIPDLLDSYSVDKIYLAGHSLGGSMVQWAFDAAVTDADVGPRIDASIENAFTYGSPGLENWRLGAESDPRLLNIGFENDLVFKANLTTSSIGEDLLIDTAGGGQHETSSYLEYASLLLQTNFIADYYEEQPGNLIAGLEGNDRFQLDDGVDYFLFREGDSHDILEGFDTSEDLLLLNGFDSPPNYKLISSDFGTTVSFQTDDSITFVDRALEEVEFILDNNVLPVDEFDPLFLA